jgi:OmpA-OmpF porin, OOP family
MKNFALRFALTALLLSGAASASAADPNWYAGVGVGYSYADLYPSDFSANNPGVSEGHKYYDAGYKIFVGRQLDKNWALEGSYVTLGKFQYSYSVNSTGDSTSLDYRVTGFGASLIPSFSLGDSITVFGRLGAFFSQTKTTTASANGAFSSSLGSSSSPTSAVSPLLGAGFQLEFNPGTAMRIEYENYGKVGNETDTGRAKVQMGTVSVVFKF